ncbi:MAG: sulfite exporter TauE/SafE family protein [Gemmatimonadetes bacterium]|nr:sulfite exporter TauE/SafE family protein [Gemmatimonadota bacterium]
MDASGGIGIFIAFTAGLLSFLSPCVLPLVPSYVTFITGLSVEDVSKTRRTAVTHALLFIAGFTIIFMLLGAGATTLGYVVKSHRVWLARVGGGLIIVFGLYLVGALNIGFLARERRFHLANKPVGYLGSVLVGIAFGAGWSPCIGPILGAILTYTASEADLQRGMLLLFTYSMGLAVPFLVAAFAVEWFLKTFQKYKRYLGYVQKVAGVLLIIVGILMITNYFTILATALQALTPEFLRSRI